jgi:hypothetical protein
MMKMQSQLINQNKKKQKLIHIHRMASARQIIRLGCEICNFNLKINIFLYYQISFTVRLINSIPEDIIIRVNFNLLHLSF